MIPYLVQTSLLLLTFSIGLRSGWRDLVSVWHRPGDLARGVLAVNIVVPLVALLLLVTLPINPATKAGILLMAVSPLAPFAPGKMLKAGAEASYVVGLYSALTLVTVIIVPATAATISLLFSRDITIPIWTVAGFLVGSVLAPLVLGVAAATLWPLQSARTSNIVNGVAYLILLPIVVLLLFKTGGLLLALIGNGAVLAIIGIVFAGLAAGHWLGGPEPSHRSALAAAAATRHPGIAGLIAHRHFDDPRVTLAILLFLLVSIAASVAFDRWVAPRFCPDEAPLQGGAGSNEPE